MESSAIAPRPPRTPIAPEADAPEAASGKLDKTTPPGLKIEGSVLLKIGDKSLTLRGTFGDGINVAYHRSLETAPAIGTIATIAGTIARALGLDEKDIETKVKEGIARLDQIKGLGSHINAMKIVLTDLVVNTNTGVYEFGIGFSFKDDPFKFEKIAVDALGVKISYVKPPSGDKDKKST